MSAADPNTESGTDFAPRFDAAGLAVCVVQHAETAEVLMVAFINRAALALTVETGIAHFWSRSRQSLWRKGEQSGQEMAVTELLTDCDQDAFVMKVIPRGHGAACHTGRRSCFYRRVTSADGSVSLAFTEGSAPLIAPEDLYPKR